MNSTLWWLVLGLLLGWLIEWVIDWVYWRQRRQTSEVGVQAGLQDDAELARLRDSLASARADNERLQAELNGATTLAQERQTTIDDLTERLAGAQANNKRLAVGIQMPRSDVVLNAGEANAEATNATTAQPPHDDTAAPAPPAEPIAGGTKTNETLLLRDIEIPQPSERRRDPLIDINGIGPAYERKLFDAGVYTFEDLTALTPEQVRAIISPQRWQEIDPAAWIAEARQLAEKKAQR